MEVITMDGKWNLDTIKEFDYYKFFENLNIKWHEKFEAQASDHKNFEEIFFNSHFFNFSLWHEEDEARRVDVSDSHIAQNKRNIDGFNQKRNDSIEKLDTYILSLLKNHPLYKEGLSINSETPGSIIDRLSIISLKIYHMQEQTQRDDVSEEHLLACKNKTNTLVEQKNDLLKCLSELIEEYVTGKKSMKVYFQFKMYNDPKLNPALYGKK